MYPGSIPSYSTPDPSKTLDQDNHTGRHIQEEADIIALATKVGADSSAVTTTHDYKLSGVTGSDKAASAATLASHTANVSNPHSVTKSQVGLANVDNTSDATKQSAVATLTNKTISGSANTLQNIPESALSVTATNIQTSVAAFTISGTSFADVTGATLSLPSAGTYLITAVIRTKVVVTSGTSFIVLSLFDTLSNATVPNSEILGAISNGAGTIWDSTPMRATITVAGASTIKLQAKKSGTLTATIEGDSNGRSMMFADRVLFA